MDTRWLDRDEQRAWRRYRRMKALLDLQLARDLTRDAGLSEPDYDVLSTLSEAPDDRWRSRDLAQRLLWSTSRLAHQVGRMEKRGLVRRDPCPDDARGAVVTLTGDGREALDAAAPEHVSSVRRHLFDLLDDEQVAALDAVAGAVLTHLTGRPDPPGGEHERDIS